MNSYTISIFKVDELFASWNNFVTTVIVLNSKSKYMDTLRCRFLPFVFSAPSTHCIYILRNGYTFSLMFTE